MNEDTRHADRRPPERNHVLGKKIALAHDIGLLNELALEKCVQRLLDGTHLSAVDLCEIFGAEEIHRARIGPSNAREDLYRAAVLSGVSALFMPFDGRHNSPSAGRTIVDFADGVIAALREKGVLS